MVGARRDGGVGLRKTTACALLVSAGCSLVNPLDEGLIGAPVEICGNLRDDDQNGDIDCRDVACAAEAACQETSEAACADGDDNDIDGKRTSIPQSEYLSSPTSVFLSQSGRRSPALAAQRSSAALTAVDLARTMSRATSSIMSSWPPTVFRRPSSTRMSLGFRPYLSPARRANSRNDE